jgi:hypothetical protein
MLMLDGEKPADPSVNEQVTLLKGLRDMLELDDIRTQENSIIAGVRVPMTAEYKGKKVAVCVTHSLTAEKYRTGIVDELDGRGMLLRPLNAYQLTRNLPSCHLAIRKCLGLQRS